jgi:hypothetical protein
MFMKNFLITCAIVVLLFSFFGFEKFSTYGQTYCYEVQTQEGVVSFESEIGTKPHSIGETIHHGDIHGTVVKRRECSTLLFDGV